MTYIIAKLHAVESEVSRSESVDRNMPPLQSTRSLTSILSFFSTKSWWATETKHSLNICRTPAHQQLMLLLPRKLAQSHTSGYSAAVAGRRGAELTLGLKAMSFRTISTVKTAVKTMFNMSMT